MKRLRQIWNTISHLGIENISNSQDEKSIIMTNRMNFILIIILSIVSILMAIIRFINHTEFTFHTQKLLYVIALCCFNLFLISKRKHLFAKINSIFIFPFIIVLLPVILGYSRNIDIVYNPLLIIGFSLIPHMILKPVFSNKIYVISLFFYGIQICFIDNIIINFSSKPLLFFELLNEKQIYYKIIFSFVFLFIHITMYYLRNMNYLYEVKLKNYNDELHSTIEELKTTQQHLVQSEKLASLGVLTSGIAHELNNPLNFIKGGILGIETYFDDNLSSHKGNVSILIDAINEGIDRSTKIISNLNHLSLSDETIKENCEINSILDNCILMLQGKCKGKITIYKTYTNQKYIVKGNESKLLQAFLSIILNSIQSITDIGEITIETLINGNFIELSITDSGCGISQIDLNHIFDPFFTTKNPGEGIGLGLTITHKIITEHNGSIEYKSQIGKGTIATIRFPMCHKI